MLFVRIANDLVLGYWDELDLFNKLVTWLLVKFSTPQNMFEVPEAPIIILNRYHNASY